VPDGHALGSSSLITLGGGLLSPFLLTFLLLMLRFMEAEAPVTAETLMLKIGCTPLKGPSYR